MNNRPILILAIVVLAICGGVLWFLQMQPAPPVSFATPAPVATTAPDNMPFTSPQTTPARRPESTAPPSSNPLTNPVPPRGIAEWELKIDQVLRSNVGETESAQLLINLIPTLPAEGQQEAAQHISNLLLDKDYSRVLPLVKNPSLPEDVLDVFVTDLMNRDDSVKLPTLLEIAKVPNHPHRDEALTDLQIFLDEDNGTDFAKWDVAVKKYVKEHGEAGPSPFPGLPKPPMPVIPPR